ncbi:site-2 protease family protein [Candidatus Daviesbacteria bacterium]|nr:site-2 protease family protein [Candidatus Daviesbacteria bacterium]
MFFSIAFTVILIIVTLLILVVIHEMGHYLAAKKFNIKVLEFGFGIPPRAWGKKIGETIYSLNWLPLGGFVRLLGEDEVDKAVLENERSFAAASVSKRIVVALAGVVMNLFLAWVLFYLVLVSSGFKTQFPKLFDHQFIGAKYSTEKMVIINDVAKNSPAKSAGLKVGERIIAINDKFIKDDLDFIKKVKENAGKKITLTTSDIKQTKFKRLDLTPRVNPPKDEGALGVGIGYLEAYNLEYREDWQKTLAGPIHSVNIATYTFNILSKTISMSLVKKDIAPLSQSVGSPIAIGFISYEILQESNPIIPYLELVALISLSLAIFNILPIPALDGGRLFFLFVEALTRKKINPSFERVVHNIGMIVLLILFFLVIQKDINQFILRR